jgi:hypothetical protein
LLADRYSETLPPLRKDTEITQAELESSDLIIMGGVEDNQLMKAMVEKLGLSVGKNFFQWQGNTYGNSDYGLFAVFPNPYNSKKVVYLVIANSALQLYEMTKKYQRVPAWALFKADRIVKKGYHPVEAFEIRF